MDTYFVVDFSLSIIIGFILTVVIYTIPILVYRFAIRKGAVRRKRAIVTTIIWAVIAILIMTIVKGLFGEHGGVTAIAFWSFINFIILDSGRLAPSERLNVDVKDFIISWAKENITRDIPVNDEYYDRKSDRFCEIAKETDIFSTSLYDLLSDDPSRVRGSYIRKVWEEAEKETQSQNISGIEDDTEEDLIIEQDVAELEKASCEVEKKTELIKEEPKEDIKDVEFPSDIKVCLAVPYMEDTKPEVRNIEERLYCRKCGKMLSTDSLFCDKCGTKVKRIKK